MSHFCSRTPGWVEAVFPFTKCFIMPLLPRRLFTHPTADQGKMLLLQAHQYVYLWTSTYSSFSLVTEITCVKLYVPCVKYADNVWLSCSGGNSQSLEETFTCLELFFIYFNETVTNCGVFLFGFYVTYQHKIAPNCDVKRKWDIDFHILHMHTCLLSQVNKR